MANDKLSVVGRARSLASAVISPMVSRLQMAMRAGLTFGGKRDFYKVFGYEKGLDYNKYLARFQRNGIASRVVTAYPQATWRNAPRVFDVDDNKRDSAFEVAWDELNEKFDLFQLFERLDVLAGLGEYGVLLIGAKGDPKSPLKTLGSIDNLLYLAPYGQGFARIQQLEQDPASPRYGLPNIYELGGVDFTHLTIAQPLPITQRPMHYSRIFHVAEGLLEGSIFGKPRLEAVWNYLDDMDKITGASAEAFWMVANRGLQFDIDKDVIAEDLGDLDTEIQEYEHGMRRTLQTQGVKVNVLASQTPDPRGAFSVALGCISGTTGIPQRIIIGSEAGQLASTQDRDNWNERIIERRSAFAEPVILRPFIRKMIDLGVLPIPKGGRPMIEWPDLMAYSAEQKSQQALRLSIAMNNYSNMIKNGVKLITAGEWRKIFAGLPAEMPKEINSLPTGITEDVGVIPGVPKALPKPTNPDGGVAKDKNASSNS